MSKLNLELETTAENKVGIYKTHFPILSDSHEKIITKMFYFALEQNVCYISMKINE